MIPTIYKRTSTGKIQTWTIDIDGNKYRTVSGQQDGKKVTSEWTVCAGKNIGRSNETTPGAQALAEAKAKLQRKLESEYKLSIDDVDSIDFKTPMLANEFKADEVEFPVYAQPKLDGMRCIASVNGLLSRKNKPIKSSPHVSEALAKIFKEHPELELDGELYNHELKDNFDELISVVKQLKPTEADLQKSKEYIRYYVYDIRDSKLNFAKRTALLKKLVKRINSEYIVFVETAAVTTKEELDSLYNFWLEEGYEGQMIRTDTPYEFKRTNALLKRKEFITDEFEIVDVIEGKGNRSGMAGKVVFKLHKPTTDGKETCEANPKGGFTFYKRLLKQREYAIGKMATIEFQNYTPKGSLRFPKMLTIRDYE